MTQPGRTAVADGPQTPVEDAMAHQAPPGLAAAAVSADGAVDLIATGLADVRTAAVCVHAGRS
jgi:hypothetical protein